MAEQASQDHRQATGPASLIGSGAELVGSTVANAAIGFVFGGPVGALAGAAQGVIGPVLSNGLRPAVTDLAARHLSQREEVRVGAAVALAAAGIARRLENGEIPRRDNFFEWKADERPAATEVAEGILRVCQRDHEEKKLPYTSRMLEGFYFTHTIDRGYANLLIRLTERLSWRQYCLLPIFANKGSYNIRATNYTNQNRFPPFQMSILFEMWDLHQIGLINNGKNPVIGMRDIVPSEVSVQGAGVMLFNLMALHEVAEPEKSDAVVALSS